jgi:hypothetical protein
MSPAHFAPWSPASICVYRWSIVHRPSSIARDATVAVRRYSARRAQRELRSATPQTTSRARSLGGTQNSQTQGQHISLLRQVVQPVRPTVGLPLCFAMLVSRSCDNAGPRCRSCPFSRCTVIVAVMARLLHANRPRGSHVCQVLGLVRWSTQPRDDGEDGDDEDLFSLVLSTLGTS